MCTRIINLRNAKNITDETGGQSGSAQIGRYEAKDGQPPAAVLKKIADTLDTIVDFLVNGNTEDKANAALQDAEVIRYFK